MIYLVPLILLLFGIYYYDYKNHQHNKYFLWVIICIILICIAGFRYRLGQDTLAYLKFYETLKPLNHLKYSQIESSRFAPGFVILLSFFKMITPEFYLFQIFQAAFVNIVFFYFFRKYAKNQFFAALVFYVFIYFVMCFQQMREAFAVGLLLLGFPFFIKRKWIHWYAISTLAFLFHISAGILFILPLIVMPGIRKFFVYGKRTIFICLGITILSLFLQAMFFKYIELLSLSDTITERAQNYDKIALGGGMLNFFGIICMIVQSVLFPYLALIYLNKEKDNLEFKKDYFRGLNDFVLMSIYVACFSIFISIMARYLNYFFPFAIIAMSYWIFEPIKLFGKKIRFRFSYWMILIFPMFFFYCISYYFVSVNKSGTLKGYMVYYPYSSILDETKNNDREKTIMLINRRIEKKVK